MKTHCPQGHKYAEGNLKWRIRSNGKKSRSCKTCYKEKHLVRQRARRERQKMEYPGGPAGYAAYVKAIRNKYVTKIRANARMKRIDRKSVVLQHYSNGVPKCCICGIDDIDMLCIDHVANNGAKHRKEHGFTGGTQIYKWIVESGFPSGFQVLCWNHNAKKEITRRREEYEGNLLQREVQ